MKKKILALALLSVMIIPANNIMNIQASDYKAISSYETTVEIEADTASYKLSAPVIKKIVNEKDGAKISWGRVKGASKYQIQRYDSKTKKWKVIGTKSGNKSTISFLDKKVEGGTTYKYKVRCVKSNGKTGLSKYSKIKTNKFITVPKMQSVKMVDKKIQVSWTASKGAYGYVVYRQLKGGKKWTKIDYTKTNSYVDEKFTFGKTYLYKVACIDKNKNEVTQQSTTETTERYEVRRKKRLIAPAYDQDVYSYGYKCNNCGYETLDYNEMYDEHIGNNDGACGSFSDCQIKTGTIHYKALYEITIYYSDGSKESYEWEDPNSAPAFQGIPYAVMKDYINPYATKRQSMRCKRVSV